MAKLVDALDLGSSVHRTWGFESLLSHTEPQEAFLLKVKVTELESWKKKVDVEVEASDVQPFVEKVINKYRNKANLDGFRKGKAPLSLIQKQFGPAITADAADEVIQAFFTQAVESENLPIVAPGLIKKVSEVSLEQTEPFTFTAEVEVEPDISVSHYKGIKVEKEIDKLSDEDVDQVLSMLQEQRAEFEPIDSEAGLGHIIEGDVQALDVTGIPMIGQKWEDRAFELGKAPLGDQVVDQLSGAKPGEERRFEIKAPNEDGQPADQPPQLYSMQIKNVKEKRIPELDDAFAQKVGEFETIKALREQVGNNIAAQREEDSDRQVRQRLADEIIHKNDFELPPALIDRALENSWEDYQNQHQHQQHEHAHATEEEFKTQNRVGVIWRLKWDMIWQKIADIEALEIDEEKIQSEIDRMASASPKEEKKIRALFKEKNRIRHLKEQLLEEETWNFLKEHAKIKEVKVKKNKKKASNIITG